MKECFVWKILIDVITPVVIADFVSELGGQRGTGDLEVWENKKRGFWE